MGPHFTSNSSCHFATGWVEAMRQDPGGQAVRWLHHALLAGLAGVMAALIGWPELVRTVWVNAMTVGWLLAHCALLVRVADRSETAPAFARWHPALEPGWRYPVLTGGALVGGLLALPVTGLGGEGPTGLLLHFALAVLGFDTVRRLAGQIKVRRAAGHAFGVGGLLVRGLAVSGVGSLVGYGAWRLLAITAAGAPVTHRLVATGTVAMLGALGARWWVGRWIVRRRPSPV